MSVTTVYASNPDITAQETGQPGAPIYAPTYAATVVVDTLNNAGAIINGVNATSATCTINAAYGGQAMQNFWLLIKDTGGVTVTLGTKFKSAGTVNPTTGKAITVYFVSDGTNFIETGRNAAAVTY
jgi:hypothetical protein